MMKHVPVFKYRMFVQARTDLTPDEIRQYEASGWKSQSASTWPWRDTGDHVYARRRKNAKAFYRELKGIPPLIQIRADYVSGRESKRAMTYGAVAMRAWRGFDGIMGTINGAADEVRHFPAHTRYPNVSPGPGGLTACGIQFSEWSRSVGKPQCPECLKAAIERHPEMKKYL